MKLCTILTAKFYYYIQQTWRCICR